MKRVLVLGKSGMLGAMVFKHLMRCEGLAVAGTARSLSSADRGGEQVFEFDAEADVAAQWTRISSSFPADFVVNCIGVINVFCRDSDPRGVRRAVQVNAMFPHLLAESLAAGPGPVRVLHITTDCVFSGRRGSYDEADVHDPIDCYGKSKSLGEVLSPNWLNLRCSIVGPDSLGRRGLLEWFLSQPRAAQVNGYANHWWNGVTTLQYAELCERIIRLDRFGALRSMGGTLHYAPNEPVSKYELLTIFNEVYEQGCEIRKVNAPGPKVDRTLVSTLLKETGNPMRKAIQAMKNYS